MKDYVTHPVEPGRWDDLERLFGPRGACGGCWCMWWRVSRSEYEENKGENNRLALKKIVQSGGVPGILAYKDGEPVGWVCVGPREKFVSLERSRVLARVDDTPVWSIVCFFINKKYRGVGISGMLLKAAVDFARQQGVKIIEGYPMPVKSDKSPEVFNFTGLEPIFAREGFEVVVRRGKTGRGVWRKNLA